jgi:hypothetical protein
MLRGSGTSTVKIYDVQPRETRLLESLRNGNRILTYYLFLVKTALTQPNTPALN